MIYKELKLQEALGDLLQNMEMIPAQEQHEDDFYHNLYWKARLYSFFDADIWIGISDEKLIREKIDEKMNRIKEQLEILLKIERNIGYRERIKKIIENINHFDASNGFLTDVIIRIKKLNQN